MKTSLTQYKSENKVLCFIDISKVNITFLNELYHCQLLIPSCNPVRAKSEADQKPRKPGMLITIYTST